MERLTYRINGRAGAHGLTSENAMETMQALAERLAAYEDTGLEPEEVSNLAYKLSGVMHFVDKWLDEDELNKDEVLRAETMRDKTLKLVEALQKELDHLRELAEAEQAERLVVLPCKVKSTVYFPSERGCDCAEIDSFTVIGDKIVANWAQYERSPELTELYDCGDFPCEEIGKTVFLTREAAEAAVKEENR